MASRTAFVPRVVLSTVFLGVVPACALAACSSPSSHGEDVVLAVIAFDSAPESSDVMLGVAADAFDDSLFSVADIGFHDTGIDDSSEAGDAPDGGSDAKTDVPLGVAADAFSG